MYLMANPLFHSRTKQISIIITLFDIKLLPKLYMSVFCKPLPTAHFSFLHANLNVHELLSLQGRIETADKKSKSQSTNDTSKEKTSAIQTQTHEPIHNNEIQQIKIQKDGICFQNIFDVILIIKNKIKY